MRFSTLFLALTLTIGLLLPQVIYAYCMQQNNELGGKVGLDKSDGTVYATITSSDNACSCTQARFKPENTDVKTALSILISGKLANKKVRIDFLYENDCDSAYRVYLE